MAGSSPLSRGIPNHPSHTPLTRRIIPALAGNTNASREDARQRGDHPRSRGEYYLTDAKSVMVKGSSPLSRGILCSRLHDSPFRRIIPALAGNTYIITSTVSLMSDHPRSRGEYTTRDDHAEAGAGSSPLSRGIRPGRFGGSAVLGIIPALAGNTAATSRPTAPPRDHPRSRGEYSSSPAASRNCSGSSPLSRGIRAAWWRAVTLGWIIPALAGNTPTPSPR